MGQVLCHEFAFMAAPAIHILMFAQKPESGIRMIKSG
jgi:hypothetical protein